MSTIGSILLPSATVTNTDTPGFLATIVGTVATAYEAKVFSAAEYGAGGFNPATSTPTWQSGIVTIATGSTSLSGTVFTDLVNGGTYRIYLRVADGPSTSYTWSAWAAAASFRTFAIAIPVPTPTVTLPVSGSTAFTSRPPMNANATQPMPGLVPMRRRFQFATDAAFSLNVVEVADSFYASNPNGIISFPSLPARLLQGSWLVRARLEDKWGVVGSWSSPVGFTVSHVPSAGSLSPASSQTVPWNGGTVTLGWVFSDIDTEDYQTKYQIQYWDTANPLATTSTGEINNAIQANNNNYSYGLPLPSTAWKDLQISWRVRVADQDGVYSAYSAAQTFYARDLPTVAVSAPGNGSTVGTPAPTITWSFAASGGRTQAQYRVSITDTTNGVVVLNTGFVFSSAQTYTPSLSVLTIGPTYQVRVDVIDSAGLSSSATSSFTSFFVPPNTPTFTVDGASMPTNGGVVVNWSGSTPNSGVQSWRVYRRNVGATTWKLIRDLPATTFGWTDYTCPSNTAVQYSVVQVALDPNFNFPVESAYVAINFTGQCDDYFIVTPDDSTLNMKLDIVVSDNLRDEYEKAVLNLMGRKRRVETGTEWGVTGSLSAQLYDDTVLTARQKKRQIDLIQSSGLRPYLRNPFGDVWSIGLMGASYDRVAGVGTREFTTVSIEYSEIEDI